MHENSDIPFPPQIAAAIKTLSESTGTESRGAVFTRSEVAIPKSTGWQQTVESGYWVAMPIYRLPG
ncbi:MAG: hypothetical protein ACR2FS_18575 [Phormidesmis sp.]